MRGLRGLCCSNACDHKAPHQVAATSGDKEGTQENSCKSSIHQGPIRADQAAIDALLPDIATCLPKAEICSRRQIMGLEERFSVGCERVYTTRRPGVATETRLEAATGI